MSNIFLGDPSFNVKQWIMEKRNPSPKPETVITFDTGEKASYDWSGDLGRA